MIKKCLLSLCFLVLLQTIGYTNDTVTIQQKNTNKNPLIQVQTTHGDFVIKLYPLKAPITCKNFIDYVNEGFYTNTLFHRVIDGFLIQGGGFNQNYVPKKTKAPIKNESRFGLSNKQYTVAMALSSRKDSATTQFFINLADNLDLDYSTKKGSGHAVFGEVIDGTGTLSNIRRIRTKKINIFSERYNRNVALHDAPEEKVIIKKMNILR
tara:strand:- start:505 stop:1131 length:627 start_codon:yes stop_codon:yes gene_type:complete